MMPNTLNVERIENVEFETRTVGPLVLTTPFLRGLGLAEIVPHLEPGYNSQGEWLQQLRLFALASGDGKLPVWFDALNGSDGDSPAYVPQFESFLKHAQLASLLPLDEVIILGDGKMATQENQTQNCLWITSP